MTKHFTLTTDSIRVTFQFEKDRFAHRIYVRRQDGWKDALASLESGDQESWPSSPPLQEIHEHESGSSMLAVGGAGTSHWSASVEVGPEGTIRFDYACRLSRAPGFLGSIYRISPELGAIEASGDLFSAYGLKIDTGELTELSVDSQKVTVTPQVNEIQLPTTIRWKYEVISAQALRTS